MALFSSEETSTPKIIEYTLSPYVLRKDSSEEEIVSYYDTLNNKAYHHYASMWRSIGLAEEKQAKKLFDAICASVIDTNVAIRDMCKNDLEKLLYSTEDTKEEVVEKNIPEYEFQLKMIYSDFWPANAIRLKAFSDNGAVYYEDGKLANFEHFLRSVYEEKVMAGKLGIDLAVKSYQRDIALYRDTYFEATKRERPQNNFYLSLRTGDGEINYESEADIVAQAIEDASSGSVEANYNFFISFQSYFNKTISGYALKIKEATRNKPASQIKYTLQQAKLRESEYTNRYSELFNLYIATYRQTLRSYALLTSLLSYDAKLPSVGAYPLNTYFDDVEETFEDILLTSLGELVDNSVSYYKETGSDEFILRSENQIRNYYQEQLSKIYLKTDRALKLTDIQKLEVPIIEEYKEKIDEFRSACMLKINYSFPNDYPPINRFVDYSFSIGSDFQGLDRRTVIEWAMQAAKKSDLSLHSLKIIKLKIGEFININCMHGDNASHKEELGSHEWSVIQERFAMIEHRLLVFGESLIENYLQYLRRYYEGDVNSEAWETFMDEANALKAEPITTYYDTSFDVASVENKAKEDRENYESGTDAPYYVKMKKMAQQKIFDINDRYAREVESAKENYVQTGKRAPLNLVLNNLRTDIDRVVDEYLKLASYYVKEFDIQDVEIVDDFEKGTYYYFQNENKREEEA